MKTEIIEVSDAHFDLLISMAKESMCHRSKCGSILLDSNNNMIGAGWNSQPCEVSGECFKDSLASGFKSDKTCCVHAEQRAIVNTLKTNPHLIKDSTLLFIRLDENGQPKHSGQPYCTICSKMALDVGVSKFALWHKEGWTAYETKYYNELSFQYKG